MGRWAIKSDELKASKNSCDPTDHFRTPTTIRGLTVAMIVNWALAANLITSESWLTKLASFRNERTIY
ncbi:hypothetical protein PGT21_000413 [Puccinia graminis f. sp. tritici]|uniref:Uncharacterized protein n=1 Tax=Puccinia graminis f. sp. tritici TaxID=56615 RepID=A0A5B0PNG3_PUCGR|nr:hypothetical protein PGT21_000413 [Puccinia graminis f. sp. tritici]